MIIRFLIYLLLFYLGFKLIRSLAGTFETGPRRVSKLKPGEIDDVMIKDPVCDVYFPKREGVHIKIEDKDVYFCSDKCRDDYMKQQIKETE